MRPFLVGLIIAVAPTSAFAELEVPQFSHGGFLVHFDYGIGLWGLDRNSLYQSVPSPVVDYFASRVQNTHTISFALGYNIKGHATIGAQFYATGWNVFDPSRGGSGGLMGTLAWHPLELVFLNKDKRPFGLDFSTWVGVGYGIVGFGDGSGPALGMDGLIVQWGLNVDYFFTKNFGVGLFAKINFLKYSTFYTDWDSAHSGGGGGLGLQNSGNNAGIFSHLGVELVLRVGD
jgi:hypothetical protein